jgi:putative DNA primase/helicase
MARDLGMQRVADPADFPPVPEPEPNADLVGAEVPAEHPLVRLVDANFSENVDQIERQIMSHVFTQGAALARVTGAESVGKVERSAGAVMLIPATREWARKRLGELCEFQRYVASRQEWVRVAPPAELVNTLLGLGSWRTLRPLDAIARAPFLRADGSIVGEPGYDPASRTLYVPSAPFPPIPPNPTRDDAAAALGRLRAPFDEFPWKERASESAFVSHILAEAARLAMERCPM